MNNRILLDTNIVIYILHGVPYADQYRPILENKFLLISAITVAELYEGAFRAGTHTRTFRNIVEGIKAYSVLPVTIDVCKCFGAIRAERRNRPISVPDALIAATALSYHLPLVTHNRNDFEDITGLEIISKNL